MACTLDALLGNPEVERRRLFTQSPAKRRLCPCRFPFLAHWTPLIGTAGHSGVHPFVRPEDLGRWSSGRADSQNDILGTLGHTHTRTRHGTHRKPKNSQNTHKNDTQTTGGHARRRKQRGSRGRSIPDFDGSGTELTLSSAVSTSLTRGTLATHKPPLNPTGQDPWEPTVSIPNGCSGTAGARYGHPELFSSSHG